MRVVMKQCEKRWSKRVFVRRSERLFGVPFVAVNLACVENIYLMGVLPFIYIFYVHMHSVCIDAMWLLLLYVSLR